MVGMKSHVLGETAEQSIPTACGSVFDTVLSGFLVSRFVIWFFFCERVSGFLQCAISFAISAFESLSHGAVCCLR